MPEYRGIEVLKPLAGRWSVEIRWSPATHKLAGGPAVVHASATLDWIEQGCFLALRMGDGGPPAARWIIGRDDDSGFAILYADTRGVLRVYEMSFAGGVWKIWRDAPGFHQRFVGYVSPDQRVIEARWEKSADGMNWEHDFDLTYTKSD